MHYKSIRTVPEGWVICDGVSRCLRPGKLPLAWYGWQGLPVAFEKDTSELDTEAGWAAKGFRVVGTGCNCRQTRQGPIELFGDWQIERLNMNWEGKELAAIMAAPVTPAKAIEANAYIEGDCLDVLRGCTLPAIDMVYIDPPYNTGQQFNYSDRETDWINMMYSRLLASRPHLVDEGAIFISLDDKEVATCRILCDEVYGRKNFVAHLIWKKKAKPSFTAKHVLNMKEHVLVFAKDKKKFAGLKSDNWTSQSNARPLLNAANKMSVRVFQPGLLVNHPDIEIPKGTCIKPRSLPMTCLSDLVVRDGKLGAAVVLQGNWNTGQPLLNSRMREITFSSNLIPRWVNGVAKQMPLQDLLLDWGWYDDSAKVSGFKYAKPVGFMERLISTMGKDNMTVLDFFAGSCTTAIAANNLGHQFVMVQKQENDIVPIGLKRLEDVKFTHVQF